MIHEIIPVGPLQCNCSIVGDEGSHEAIVIDPGDDIEQLLAVIERYGLTVKQIVITHAHIDHIGGAAKLKRITGAPVIRFNFAAPPMWSMCACVMTICFTVRP